MNDRFRTVKDRLNPEDVARRFGADRRGEVKRTTSGFAVRCPVHDDENPSAVIYADGKGWHCSGCHAGGTLLDFVALFIVDGFSLGQRLSESDLDQIESRMGIATYSPRPATRIVETAADPAPDFSAFSDTWRRQLLARDDLLRYLSGRGIHDPQQHGLGWVGGTVPLYHDRIAIPFQCCEAWKFRAAPDSNARLRFLAAGRMSRPYGFQRVRIGLTRAIITVEGELDAAALNELLPEWAAALARPAHGWKKEDAAALWFVSHIYDCPDNDEAGQSSHQEKIALIPRTRLLRVPSGYKDVGEYFSLGTDAVRGLIRPVLEVA